MVMHRIFQVVLNLCCIFSQARTVFVVVLVVPQDLFVNLNVLFVKKMIEIID